MRSVFFNLLIVIAAHAATLDRVAVVVGNHVITQGEVMDELRLEEFTTSQPLDTSPDLLRAAADRLVDQQLIRNEMEIAHYPQPEPSAVDGMLRNFYQQHFRTKAEYQSGLAKYGITEAQLKDYLRWQLATLRFTDERFHTNVPEVSDQPAAVDAIARSASPQPRAGSEASRADTSANRSVAGGDSEANSNDVDSRLDAWLKQARSSTKVVIKKEAFQ